MDQPFDPYYQWLGIPPRLQPPHHYRLLGLEVFESNPAVIEVAADRQMTHVRAFQLGPYSDWSQQLLNELSSAKICLLTPERKAAYDAELRKKLAASGDAAAGSAVTIGGSGGTFGAYSDDEELDLAPEPPSSFGGSSSKNRSSDSRVARRKASVPSRESPSASGIGKALPPEAQKPATAVKPAVMPSAPSPSLADVPVLPSTPARAWHYEPPYMAEYRRKFFENLVRVCVFLFILAIAFILFIVFVLPLFKESSTPPDEPPAGLSTVPSVPIEPPPPASRSGESANSGESVSTGGGAVPPPPTGVAEQPAERTKTVVSYTSPVTRTTSAQVSDPEAFIGRWRTYQDGRYVSTITLLADHSARDSRHPMVTGVWDLRDGEAHIEWNDGWRQILRQDRKEVRSMSFSPDDPYELQPVNDGTAVRDEKSPE